MHPEAIGFTAPCILLKAYGSKNPPKLQAIWQHEAVYRVSVFWLFISFVDSRWAAQENCYSASQSF